MTEGGFYQQKRMSPQAVGIVVLLHGAALTALLMAKGEMVTRIVDRPIVIDSIRNRPPPPKKQPPPQPQKRQIQDTQPTTIISIVQPPIDHGPIVPPSPPPPIGDIFKTDPPLPPGPPTPPQSHKGEPARARGDLSAYVHDTDYPDSALRNEEQGTTRFRLQVAADGRVTDCTVTGSSGSSALDAATCRLMKSRARFSPERDSSGNPTTDSVANAIRWVLPDG